MKVKIDREGCIGCGLCASTCPEVFRMADDGRAEVWQQPDPALFNMVQDAAENCPVAVIHPEA